MKTCTNLGAPLRKATKIINLKNQNNFKKIFNADNITKFIKIK